MTGVALLALSVACTATGEFSYQVASRGRALGPVVVAADASPSVRESAQALAEYLGKITSGAFTVETGDGTRGIAVGMPSDFPALKSTLAERFAETQDLAALQSYLLRSHHQGIQAIGASELAVEYAVWDLLYRLGHRQFFPGKNWEVIPHQPTLELAVDAYEKPDYLDRRIWYGFGGSAEPKREWDFRNRMNVHGWRVDWRLSMPARWKASFIENSHAYGAIIEVNKEAFAQHPEYYALVKDKRAGSKLCIANPAVPPLAVKYALNYFARHPHSVCVSMEPSDGYGWCECDACQALGSPADRAVLLANAVAAALEQDYPDKYVGLLAYAMHADPPAVPAHPRVVVSVATQLSGNVPAEERLKGLGAKAKTLGIYEYYAITQWHLAMPAKAKGSNLLFLRESIPGFHALGARVMVAESGESWGPCGLGFYVASRLLWRTADAQHVDAIVEDFLDKAFGPAKEPMREFYRVIDGSQQKPGTPAFFAERAAKMYGALLRARVLVQTPEQRARVDSLALYTRYVELTVQNWQAQAAKPAGETAEDAARRKAAALERLVRWAYKINETGLAHWAGFVNVVNGAKAIDVRKLPEGKADGDPADLGRVTPKDIDEAWAAAEAFVRQ
ncbi:MAG: DUF4838 domain-containing protein [Armatimonadota bacterium]